MTHLILQRRPVLKGPGTRLGNERDPFTFAAHLVTPVHEGALGVIAMSRRTVRNARQAVSVGARNELKRLSLEHRRTGVLPARRRRLTGPLAHLHHDGRIGTLHDVVRNPNFDLYDSGALSRYAFRIDRDDWPAADRNGNRQNRQGHASRGSACTGAWQPTRPAPRPSRERIRSGAPVCCLHLGKRCQAGGERRWEGTRGCRPA